MYACTVKGGWCLVKNLAMPAVGFLGANTPLSPQLIGAVNQTSGAWLPYVRVEQIGFEGGGVEFLGSRLSFTCSICKSSSHVSDLCVQYRARAFSVAFGTKQSARRAANRIDPLPKSYRAHRCKSSASAPAALHRRSAGHICWRWSVARSSASWRRKPNACTIRRRSLAAQRTI